MLLDLSLEVLWVGDRFIFNYKSNKPSSSKMIIKAIKKIKQIAKINKINYFNGIDSCVYFWVVINFNSHSKCCDFVISMVLLIFAYIPTCSPWLTKSGCCRPIFWLLNLRYKNRLPSKPNKEVAYYSQSYKQQKSSIRVKKHCILSYATNKYSSLPVGMVAMVLLNGSAITRVWCFNEFQTAKYRKCVWFSL